MELTHHSDGTANVVRAWSEHRIQVGEQLITRSVVVHPRQLILDWPPDSVAALQPAHMDPVLALDPEIVLLGTGAQLRFPAPQLMGEFRRRGIGLEVMDTGAACRTYNVLVYEGRIVVAALILDSAGG